MIDEERNTWKDFINHSDSDNQQQLDEIIQISKSARTGECGDVPAEHTSNEIRHSDIKNSNFKLTALPLPHFGLLPHIGLGIRNMAILNDELFAVWEGSSQVNVYNVNDYRSTHIISINGSSGLHAITTSKRCDCLYISDVEQRAIYKYSLSNDAVTRWEVGGRCKGLSVTSTDNVLVTLEDTNQVEEYTPDGRLFRVIDLASYDSSIRSPQHCVQSSFILGDRLTVSHGGYGSPHGVSTIDLSERVVHFYGGAERSGVGKLSFPGQLAVDKHGNVLVIDSNNHRVVLLSPTLTHVRYITVPGHDLNHPSALCLDERNHCLYIGELSGRMFAVKYG